MCLTTVSNQFGTFLSINGQILLRGYGGLKSDMSNFRDAVDLGVKFFDGAFAYKNDALMREALVGRDVQEFVLSSKIPSYVLKKDDLRGSTEQCFNEILTQLHMDKIDILYLHGPDCIHKDVLDVLVELKEQEKIQYIGLSNVNKRTIETLVKTGYPIAIIQNEVNPHHWDKEVVDFCRENEMVFVGYRPFGDKQSTEMFENEILRNIAFRVNGSVQEVILQWMNQKGVTPIPHSNNRNHTQDNMKTLQWYLTQEEMQLIDRIKEDKVSTCGWEKFLDKDLLEDSKQWIGLCDS